MTSTSLTTHRPTQSGSRRATAPPRVRREAGGVVHPGVDGRAAVRSVAGGLLGLVLAVLLAAAVAVAVAAAAGTTPHVELSDSMAPTLRAGDVVWLDRIAAAEAARGDVVAFHDPEREAVVLHRVERVRATTGGRLSFTTRGDANNASETWAIPLDGRIGRYVGVKVPHAGRAVRALQGPPLAIVAGLGGLALAGLALRRIWS